MRIEEASDRHSTEEITSEWAEVAPLFLNIRSRHTQILEGLTSLRVRVDSLIQQWASEDKYAHPT